MTTVLVTGVGAIIGYGVLNALRNADPAIKLIGADIYSDAVGQEWADDFVVAPYTSDDGYAKWLEGVVRKYDVDLIIPCSLSIPLNTITSVPLFEYVGVPVDVVGITCASFESITEIAKIDEDGKRKDMPKEAQWTCKKIK